ncbi:histidinol-phosphatase [Streptomyces mashuensis]|uniref:Histidinol-phosphatase n=1 Tax=Streptomyces mashuensis TaxID=33904 RepID=A0A919B5E0_9ACTN|nr:inositol monophosphatase [Streptomyces mashuensis]GHF52136.1 histidinol-phosphatase [Streptomyces mashuensis]
MDLDEDFLLAERLVGLADSLALTYFGAPNPVRDKTDGSPVSEADLAVEHAMLDLLRRERPGDAVLSEETGGRGSSGRRWIIDPIDGTVPFLAGGRGWGTHVALEVDGELEIGAVSRPTENTVYWARRGRGAYVRAHGRERRLRIGGDDGPGPGLGLGAARVSGFLFPESPVRPHVEALPGWTEWQVSAIGDLVEGRVDAVADEGGKVWDRAPAVLLVLEAGGRVDDLSGGRRLDAPWLLYSAPSLGAELTAFVRQRL